VTELHTVGSALVVLILAVLLLIVSAAIRTLIGQEIKGWIPYDARWLMSRGLRHLPPDAAARYQEECEADLAALGDRPLTMLCHALQMHKTARQLAAIIGREELAEEADVDDDILVEELGLGVGTYVNLKRMGFNSVGDLISLSEAQLLSAGRQMGRELDGKQLADLRETLHVRGLALL
jgi:hypothetical protein